MAKNYYDILGVQKNSSKDDVKKAFRTLAHKYHPDKNGGDAEKFKEINEAYQVLSDDKKRAEYDSYGQVFGNGAPGGGGGFGGAGGFEDINLGDIFSEFFGGGMGQQRVRRGRDISVDVEISFKEAVFGVERNILLHKASLCDTCKGSGGKTGTTFKKCAICGGAGKIHEARQSFFGTFSSTKACADCRGTGEIPKEACAECRGTGVTEKQREINIRIPAGIEGGEMIRLTGAGEAVGRGGIAGDLYIKVHVHKHPVFKKEGNDLVMNLPIKLSDALLGATYTIPTLEGDIEVDIPKGVSFGETLRVKGKGVPVSGKKRGDLLIVLNINIPAKLSKTAEKLIKELKNEGV